MAALTQHFPAVALPLHSDSIGSEVLPHSALAQIQPRPVNLERSAKVVSCNPQFHRVILDLAKEIEGLNYKFDQDDTWICKITYGNKRHYTFGFDIGVNSGTTKSCCDDKAATSFGLGDVPHIEHKLIERGLKDEEVIRKVTKIWRKYEQNIVCKPKAGTGGVNVHHIKDELELQSTALKLYKKAGDLCISPYSDIQHEYRLIMFNGEPEIVFEKERLSVEGNGKDSVKILIENLKASKPIEVNLSEEKLDSIPPAGEAVRLTWKHNLCFGAKARLIKEFDTPKLKQLVEIAKRAFVELNLKLASIDIVEVEQGELKVLEVNNGVMTESLIAQYGDNMYNRVKLIFGKALCRELAISHSKYNPGLKDNIFAYLKSWPSFLSSFK